MELINGAMYLGHDGTVRTIVHIEGEKLEYETLANRSARIVFRNARVASFEEWAKHEVIDPFTKATVQEKARLRGAVPL